MADLIAVQCPHCGATLPPREASGSYACDYCGTRFAAAESKSARTHTGLQITPEQLAQLVATAARGGPGAAAGAPVRRGGGGGKIVALVLAVVAVIVGVVVVSVLDQVKDAGERFQKTMTPTSSQSAADAKREAKEEAREARRKAKEARKRTRAAKKAGLTLADMGKLDGDGWVAVRPDGIIGELASFDPIANLPWAMSLARAWSPDVRLVRLDIDRVDGEGQVRLVDRDSVDYRFYSPARRKSARTMAEVSDKKVVSEFRILVRSDEVQVMQSAMTSLSRRDDPGADVACPPTKVIAAMKPYGLPMRPRYTLTLSHSSSDQAYRWRVGYKNSGPERLPAVDAKTCEPHGGRLTAEGIAKGAKLPDRKAFRTLKDCACKTDIDGKGGADAVQLAVEVLGGGTVITGAGTRREISAQYYLDIGSAKPWLLPVAKDTAPAATIPDALDVLMGCRGDVLVVASEQHATAWSLSRRERLWTKPLGGHTSRPAGARPGGLTIGCKRLPIRGDVVAVPLIEGVTARLALGDGKRL